MQNISLSCPRPFDQGLIIVIVYYFQICNKKKKHKIIINRVISSLMGPLYIETSVVTLSCNYLLKNCIYIYIYIYSFEDS